MKSRSTLIILASCGDVSGHCRRIQLQRDSGLEGHLGGSELDGHARIERPILMLLPQRRPGHAIDDGIRVRQQVPHSLRRRWDVNALVNVDHDLRSILQPNVRIEEVLPGSINYKGSRLAWVRRNALTHRQSRRVSANPSGALRPAAIAPWGYCGARATRDEQFAAVVHSITFSALIRSDCGILRPSAFAVLPLMNNSNIVGCSTGKSPGFAPLKILST